MKEFIIKSVLFVLLLALSIMGIYSLSFSKQDNDYFSAIIDKDSLLRNTSSPKVILVGGSNLAFGVDSKMLDDSLQMPVVNMGLYADVGIDFMLNHAKSGVKRGDVVVLVLEYFINAPQQEVLEAVLKVFPEGNDYVGEGLWSLTQNKYHDVFHKNFDQLIPYDAETLLNLEKESNPNEIYRRDGFNKYGDVITHLGKESSEYLVGRKQRSIKTVEAIEVLNEFYEEIIKKGAKAMYLYPPQPESEWNKNKEVYRDYHKQLKNSLKMPLPSVPEDFIYPDTLFFDSVYHLTKKGREERTKEVYSFLKALN